MNRKFTTLIALSLLGCAPSKFEQAQMIEKSEKSQCRQLYKSGVVTTHTAEQQCFNLATDNTTKPFMLGNVDLFDEYEAAKIVVAEKEDKGIITSAEAQLEYKKLYSRFISLSKQRENAEIAATAQAQSAEAQEEAADALQGISKNLNNPPNVTCTTLGNTTNCH